VTALPWRISLSALAVWSVLSSLFLTATAESPRPLPVAAAPCVSAEDCFRSAVALNERSGSPAQRDQTMMLKIDQLRSVMDLYPSTIWAKRAGVVLGVLLIEREPVEAAKRLRVVQPDMPVLDDYLRLWIGESLLKQNEPIQAAELLETIPKIVPDSSLIAKAAYRTGEAWYSANVCFRAVDWLGRAVVLAEKDPAAPLALWHQAECHIRENRLPEARTALKQLWLRYPHSPEAREAKARLDTALGGESWAPTAEDHSIRAQAFLGLAMQAEAVEELRRFLAMAPGHPRRFDARLKLGVAYVRLKQYDQARETFRALVADRVQESSEATVWLARVYLRQSQGDKLIGLARSVAQGSLGGDQRATVHLFAGVWLEDQGQFDEAIGMFRQVAKLGDSASQRAEGLWRAGWAQYRTARYRDAAETFRSVVELHVNGFEPQAMYWAARADEHEKNTTVVDQYTRLCQRHAYSYYCQLAARRGSLPPVTPVATTRSARQATRRHGCRRIGVLKLNGTWCINAALSSRYWGSPRMRLANWARLQSSIVVTRRCCWPSQPCSARWAHTIQRYAWLRFILRRNWNEAGSPPRLPYGLWPTRPASFRRSPRRASPRWTPIWPPRSFAKRASTMKRPSRWWEPWG
jgi:soluble lytic murein transglycosylase